MWLCVVNIRRIAIVKILIYTFLIFYNIGFGFTQQTLINDTIIHRFYAINHQKLYWVSSSANIGKAFQWMSMIESSGNLGFNSNKLKLYEIYKAYNSINRIDSVFFNETDYQITAMVLNYLKVLQQGNIKFDYDEINITNDSVYIYQLLGFKKRWSVSKIVSKLESKDADYLILKKYLKDSVSINDTLKYKVIILAMNYRRYFTANHFSEYIMVNIPTAEAEYYRNDSLLIKMNTVTGKKKTQTPLIASYITNIVTFPSWNIPYTIAVNEILPKAQKNDNYLEQNNIEVFDANGNAIEESEINWNNFNERNFHYYFRQSSGTDNALGLIKFNLQNPFRIFLHSTSWQGVFAKENRFLSHGCIRLEKPFELANAILNGKIDIEELTKGKKGTETQTIKLTNKIPVFIIYCPVLIVSGKLVFLDDVYGLIK